MTLQTIAMLAYGCYASNMLAICKRIVVDQRGRPRDVIIPWTQFCEMSEALGFDLDKKAKTDLRAARRDLKRRNSKAFRPLSSL